MEKIMFFMAAIVACSSAAAEYEYMPLVQEGKVWEYQARDNGNQSDNVCMMEFRGDTLINDTTFKKLYFYDTKTLTSPQWPLAYMCEIDKKVYARINDAMCEALQKGPYNEYSIMRDYSETVLLYDFNNMAKQQFAGMPSSVTPARWVYAQQRRMEKRRRQYHGRANRGNWPQFVGNDFNKTRHLLEICKWIDQSSWIEMCEKQPWRNYFQRLRL